MSERPTVLVVGGAGYIGSHMVWLLGQKRFNVVTLDNLSSGHRDAVLCGRFVQGDIADKLLLDQLFKEHHFDAVMHFASSIQVGESVLDPSKYYRNNLINTLNLLNAMHFNGVNKFIFSSTAAIFGDPEYTPIDEAHPKRPVSPYGWSKLMVEQILSDYDRAYELKSVCLRYFNAAGAHPDGILGERHNPETHLIPLVLQAASGRLSHITVFGSDYDTRDGTCVRDYIHILDLVEAHLLTLDHLLANGSSRTYNLGNGTGYSVSEIIREVEHLTLQKILVRNGPRRSGDPAVLVADSRSIRNNHGWNPVRNELQTIISDAWKFSNRVPLAINS